MKLYIAGPMRGIPHYNFEAFDAVRDALIENGHEPISPADHDRAVQPDIESTEDYALGTATRNDDPTFQALMGWDLHMVSSPETDGIVLLPGWEHSTGAGHELYVARAAGKKVFHAVQNANGSWSVGNQDVPPTIIGLSGYAQAGKDTAGAALVEHLDFERVSFADALRSVVEGINPLTLLPPAPGFDEAPVVNYDRALDMHGYEDLKKVPGYNAAREILQRTGMVVRDILGETAWVDAAMAKVKPGGRYVFTDVRFPNEAAAIEAAGGQVWRITRAGSDPVNAHPSETALDGHTFHTVISNTGEDLAGFQSLVVANARVHL